VSCEAMKAVARQYWLAYESGDVDSLTSHLHREHVYHGEGGGEALDLDGRRLSARFFFSAFSDIRVIVEDQVAEGDRVASRITMQATHSGSFLDLPPSGRRVSIPLLDLVRVREGRILEEWAEFDWQALRRQLGEPEPAR
jgi:C-1 hydroxylase